MDASQQTTLNGNWVRIMCDYCADAVWDREGCAADADDLPVTPELRARLRAWQGDYETHDTFQPRGGWSDERWAAFTVEGRAIAEEVKRQLPDWTVVFLDEVRLDALIAAGGEDIPRHLYETEIGLDTSAAGPSPVA